MLQKQPEQQFINIHSTILNDFSCNSTYTDTDTGELDFQRVCKFCTEKAQTNWTAFLRTCVPAFACSYLLRLVMFIIFIDMGMGLYLFTLCNNHVNQHKMYQTKLILQHSNWPCSFQFWWLQRQLCLNGDALVEPLKCIETSQMNSVNFCWY